MAEAVAAAAAAVTTATSHRRDSCVRAARSSVTSRCLRMNVGRSSTLRERCRSAPRSVNPSRIAMCSPRVRPDVAHAHAADAARALLRHRIHSRRHIRRHGILATQSSRPERFEHSVAATATVAAWSQLLGIAALLLLHACSSVDPGWSLQMALRGDGWPRCKVCHELRPPQGSSHCRSCDACVAGFDHHCSVLGICIARGNRHFFVGLLGAASLCLLPLAYATFACARLELLRAGGWSLLQAPTHSAPQLAWLPSSTCRQCLAYRGAAAAVAAGCVFHVALLLCGSTTREFDRSAQRVLRRWRGRSRDERRSHRRRRRARRKGSRRVNRVW